MRTTDNASVLGSQNNNDDSMQMMRNVTSSRQLNAMNLGNMDNSMSDSLSPEEAQLKNKSVSNNGNKKSNTGVLNVMDLNNNDLVEGYEIMSPNHLSQQIF